MLPWFSCREYTQRVCHDLDGTLAWNKRPGLWFHHMLCMMCRRANRQLRVVQLALEGLKERGEEDFLDSSVSLSSDRRERIRDEMRKVDQNHGG